jgi:hypothetical protein
MAAVKESQKAQTVDQIEQEMLGPKKSAHSKKNKEGELPKEKKPLGKPGVTLLVSLAWLAVLSIFILFVLNDPTEDSSVRGWLLLRLNPESLTREEIYVREIFDLQEGWREIEAEREGIDLERGELLLYEEELAEWEDELHEWEMSLEDRLGGFTNGDSGGSFTPDIIHAAGTVQRMEPSAAAAALQEMDFDSALRICSLISPKRLAPIGNAMDTEFLVVLLEALGEPADEWDDW